MLGCVLGAQSCLTLCSPANCSLPVSSVHEILQARILEWVAMPSSRGSYWPRDWTWVSSIEGRFFTIWATRRCLDPGKWQVAHQALVTVNQVSTNLHIWQLACELSNAYRGGILSCTQVKLPTPSPFLMHSHGQGHSFPVGPGSILRHASHPENVKLGKVQTNHHVQTI